MPEMGLSRRKYATRRGVSEKAVRKAIAAGRITVEADGTIDPEKADRQWAAQTDPAMQRGKTARATTKPVPKSALRAVDETLRDAGAIPEAGGEMSFMRARMANEVLKAQTAKLRLQKMKDELVDRSSATAMVFDLARRERDAWLGWPSRVAANMAAELGVEPHLTEQVLDKYCIHRAPGPFLAVQPTVDLAKRLSQQRINPLVEESPELRELIMPSRSRDSGNTILAKRFPGGQLILTGANSAVGLRSMPARWIFLDEVDAYPGDIDGEGDPIALAEARTISFGHRAKVFLTSTPTIKGVSRIEREYELSDQRRYFVPCPHCGGMQWLQFERLRWAKGHPETARYICEHCEEPIEERFKTRMMDEANGACWMATADDGTRAVAEAAGVVGYHINGLYSPLGWLGWAEIARSWEEAAGNDAALKTLKNTVLGETWQEKGEAPDWQRLYERREAFQLGHVPAGVLVLTAGADVQRDRIEIDIWGWGRNLQSWLIEHVVIDGDTGSSEVWDRLSEFLATTWPHVNGARMALARMAIDTGDGVTTAMVYAWVRAAGRGQVIAIKGVGGFDRSTPVDGPTYVETTEGGRKLKRGVQLWKVAGAVFKSELYRLLRLTPPTDDELAEDGEWPAGYVHIPKGTPAEWFRQLTAEHLMVSKTRQGFQKLEWQQIRERNEALDCRVYARAAAWLMGIDRWDERRWEQLEEQLRPGKIEAAPAGVPNRPPHQQIKRRPSDWMGTRRGKWF